MANVGVVTQADKVANAAMANAARPAPPVLPLDRRVRAADSPERAAGAGVEVEAGDTAQIVTNDVDALTALAAFFHQPHPPRALTGPPRQAGEAPSVPNVEGTDVQQERSDFELALAPGLIHVPGIGELSQAAAPAGLAETGPDRTGSTSQHLSAAGEAGPDASVEARVPGGVSAGATAYVFDTPQPERTHERQTVLTQFSQDGPTVVGEGDVLRFTYHFRSWQGQPAAMISLNFNDSGRKLRVEAPDRAVYAALLANSDALPGILKIVDDEPHERGREGRQWEHGE
jgi:hypothetical protein